MIVLESVTKIYGKQIAVDNISFTVQQGEILGFLGPNGAGKSTTMKMITTYLTPTAGKITVCGLDTQTQYMQVREKIGYLPEHNPLYLDMYVKEYLLFVAKINHIPRREVRSRIAEMIEICGLTKEQHKKIGMLSKGYRQRVGLAQALIHKPDVLILDEPTTGLDPNQIIEIRNLIKEVGKEKTVIFSTHILSEVEAICDRVVIINEGKIVANDTLTNLKQGLSAQNYIELVVDSQKPIDVQDFEGLVHVTKLERINENVLHLFTQNHKEAAKELFDRCVQKGYVVISIGQHEKSIESLFKVLTQSSRSE
ncbi:MAG: gliding motility-associated ABC transporter ATP-binding subunit GldA [Bacteroidia bacterium]|nr:gliding motility-associated ABC transporter ATP-binding subunit GldA [Bacteroidia bacterium]MDW8302709.1 gliding motility-associated ABC transporter ATP-binding subunit GldA [Bacteroidia bacterium]